MINILHGDNIAASRKELDRIKSGFEGEILILDGTAITETDYVQATQSGSMFSSNRLVVIEGLPKFDLGNPTEEVIVWASKKITPPKDTETREFKIPHTIWA